MKQKTLIYRVNEIPDPFFPQYQMAAGGDVLDAACRDLEHLLRSLVNFSPESASLAIRYIFTPKPSSQGMQSRLSIYVMARALDPSMSESLRLLLERGPLSRFYHLEPVTRIEAPWEKLQATCDVLRREDAVSPLHSSEYNYKIPAYYYAIELDFWDYLGNDSKWRSTSRQGIKPLYYRDPFADDVLRSQQRFHETLLQPHQMFHIKVFAETQAVALLLGSVVAESAFEKGSYRLIGFSKDESLYNETLDSVNKIKVSTLPGNESFFPEKALSLYSSLSRLCHASTVDELLGVFRLPVASSISPCCIRKNTDPPIESEPIELNYYRDLHQMLDRLHTEQACLLTLFLLTNIREYLKTLPKSAKDPRYVIIIEEAHNIVGRTGQAMASPDVADPKAFAAEYVVRMLAELRALGVGIVIVDQLPSAVASEVIKSTASKIAFRQVAKEDREELGASMLFGQTEIEEIARLKTGEAFFISERYHGPRRIETENLHNRFDFNTPVFNQNIIPYLINDGWYQEVFTDRIIADLAMLKEKMDRFDDEMSLIRLKIASLLAKRPQIIAKLLSGEKTREMDEIWNEAKKLEKLLLDTLNSFLKNSYRKYINSMVESEVQNSLVLEMRENLIDRFKSIIKPNVEQSLGILKSFIGDFRGVFN